MSLNTVPTDYHEFEYSKLSVFKLKFMTTGRIHAERWRLGSSSLGVLLAARLVLPRARCAAAATAAAAAASAAATARGQRCRWHQRTTGNSVGRDENAVRTV